MDISESKSSCDKWLETFYGRLSHSEYALLDRAARTLLGNISGGAGKRTPWTPWRGIMPSHIGFNGIWNWDTAFHAMGVSCWDLDLAREQIRMFLSWQKDSGLLPDVLFGDGRMVDAFGKPPLLPWAAMGIDEKAHDDVFVREIYPKFVRYESFWREFRGGKLHGLFNYDANEADPETRLKFAKYESGWDNSPRWDEGIYEVWPVDLNCFMVMFYRSLKYMAEQLGLQEESRRWRAAGNALSHLIEEQLWDKKSGAYLDYDFQKRRFVDVLTPASFMPLFIGAASRERAELMAEIGASEKKFSPGWPSVAYDDKAFDPEGYWRGRTWLNIAYFALKGLKNYGFSELADKGRVEILGWLQRAPAYIYENYNPVNGKHLGCPAFSWSAAFTIKFILDWDNNSSMK